MDILKAQFELTPEDLIPVIEKILEWDPINAFTSKVSDLYLEIPLIYKRKDYSLPEGRVAQGAEAVKQTRPEFSRIMFFNREIGNIRITLTSSYPTKSLLIITGKVRPDNDKNPKAMDSDSQAAGVLQRLAAGIMQTLPAALNTEAMPVGPSKHNDESKQFKLPKEERKNLVNKYRSEYAKGNISNKNTWAENHGICFKTLKRYEAEFPE